ncbi:hypothetical protein [Paracoccus aestuariivivens]|uniref:hypothetical protein n=1 Tax=Paracoccus aestuariivivens TaxID=1820333 RepID=UPI001B8AC008|nr:hypothetical protein [Paracoccus aestuariivivens]
MQFLDGKSFSRLIEAFRDNTFGARCVEYERRLSGKMLRNIHDGLQTVLARPCRLMFVLGPGGQKI